jgi:hypothetical protein
MRRPWKEFTKLVRVMMVPQVTIMVGTKDVE